MKKIFYLVLAMFLTMSGGGVYASEPDDFVSQDEELFGGDPVVQGSSSVKTPSEQEPSEGSNYMTLKRPELVAFRRVQIVVHKTMKETGRQYMEVFLDKEKLYEFTVSTAYERTVKGKSGRIYFARTPVGAFAPDAIYQARYSNLWKVWLKYVIPFSGGVWIHATTPDHYAELGAPASGGCVRMHEDDAHLLYELVMQVGLSETAITVLPPKEGEKQDKPKVAPGR